MDEARLLELIEGELADADAVELRARIADDPALEAWVERVRADRDVIRALEDPDLPRDFLAELEPLLARPMLVEPSAEMNAFQRRHEQQRRAMKLAAWSRKFAAAAVIVLVVGGGLWGVVQFAGSGGGGAVGPVAVNDGQPGELVSTGDGGVMHAPPAPDATVHHYAPPIGDVLASAGDAATDEPVVDAALPRGIALVIRSSSNDDVEMLLATAMTPYLESGALVRNLTYDDAAALDQQLRRGIDLPNDAGAPMRASAGDDADRDRTPVRIDNADPNRRDRNAIAAPLNQVLSDELLAGNRDQMPDYDMQLEYSGAGATYSVAVPADAVESLLRFLVLDGGADAQLIVLPDAAGIDDEPAAITADQWMQDRAQVTRWLDARQREATGTVQFPVIVISE